MKVIKGNWIIVPIFFLNMLTACGEDGIGHIDPFTMNTSVALGDLNGDGFLDLALSTEYVSGSSDHPGHVAVYLQDAANPGVFFSPKNYDVGTNSANIAISDLNNDGRLDLVVANSHSNDVSVLLHDATSPDSFLPAVNYACGKYPDFVAIGDLNGDGRPDIAVSISGGVGILFQDPANPGSFLPAIFLTTSSGTSAVAIGDVNGDGKYDLVAISANPSTIFIFIQEPNSPGTFLPAYTYGAGRQPLMVVINDINGDGLLDLVVVNYGEPSNGSNSTIMIRLQDPANPGQFPAETTYPSANFSSSVAVADLNGDGRPDLAVASSKGIRVFLQDTGTPGTFLTPQSYQAGNSLSIAIGDLNGDGKPDLALEGGPWILFQNPSSPGIFAPVVNIPLH